MKEFEDKGIPIKNLPPPPKSENPDYVLCNSCNRRFNPISYERHSKGCANIINKPKALMRKDYGKNNRGY